MNTHTTPVRNFETEISVVVPAFNEAANIPGLVAHLRDILADCKAFEIIVVDDGSTDTTADVMRELIAETTNLSYVRLSRNFGHQAALRAGLSYANGAAVISIDADHQHPPEVVPKLIAKWREGYDIVTTKRNDSIQIPAFKRLTSRAFYAILNRLGEVTVSPGMADFRLLDRRVVNVINDMPEADLFLRGMIPWLGFRTANVEFNVAERLHGNTKYTLRKMTSLAAAGIVAQSMLPLRISILLAGFVAALTVIYVTYALWRLFVNGDAIPGWASVIVCVNLIGALQLIVLGVIGEYLGRVLRESRRRPAFVVSEATLPHREARP
ncbi:glycosyltransferase family 2 protein [Bosea massiliensis]|uniref:Glycosyltransferase family 2 protein n=1 Tax=Bosea massiliensis TaxID=151419 RepID=A0ABW0PA53_9HYPH